MKSQSVGFPAPPPPPVRRKNKHPLLHAASCLYMTVTAGWECVCVCVRLHFSQKALTMEDTRHTRHPLCLSVGERDTTSTTSSAISILKCPPQKKNRKGLTKKEREEIYGFSDATERYTTKKTFRNKK